MKKYFLLLLICIPIVLLDKVLDFYIKNPWVSLVVFFIILVIGRVLLFLYRRSKGIKDGYLDE
ncbi:hypothetical protein ABCS64_07045 [Rhodocyclaceae bacterium Wk13]|uniref:Uncharacterized protein n=1 Tax=Dentiradicibacter hellwigii TaxID=3149053 RepID=A0ABV4UEJ8_9RHOO